MPSLSEKKRNKVYSKTDGRCAYCGISLHRKCSHVMVKRGRKSVLQCDLDGGCFHVEHLIPKSKGGSYSKLTNLVPSCAKCNMQKGDMETYQFFDKCIKKKEKMSRELNRLDCIIVNIENHLL